jgi:hypothetical protein
MPWCKQAARQGAPPQLIESACFGPFKIAWQKAHWQLEREHHPWWPRGLAGH